MEKNDEQFEAFLREFQPREPRPLPLPAADVMWRRRLLAAAVVILAGSASLWFATRHAGQTKLPAAENSRVLQPEAVQATPKLSLPALTRLAQSDPRQFDAVLDADSRRTLPDFQEKGSTLASLAKE